MPEASRLEAALKKNATAGELAIELIQGDRGVFDVRADGRLIYSKKTEGRFPTADDIVKRL